MARIVAHIFTRAEILPRLRAAIPDLAFPVQSMNAKNPDGEWIKPTDGNVLKWASIEDLAFSLADLLTIGYQAFQLQFESTMGRGEVTRTLHADELTQDVARVDLPLLVDLRAEISRVNRAAGETVFNPALTQCLDSAIKAARKPLGALRCEITAGEYFDICVARTATCESIGCIEYDEVFHNGCEVWGPAVKLGEGGKVGLEISSNGVTSSIVWVDRKVVLKLRN